MEGSSTSSTWYDHNSPGSGQQLVPSASAAATTTTATTATTTTGATPSSSTGGSPCIDMLSSPLPPSSTSSRDGDNYNSSSFGISNVVDNTCQLDDLGFAFIRHCINWIESRGLEDQGLYRQPGVASRVNRLISTSMDRRKHSDEDAGGFGYSFDSTSDDWEIRTVTSALKQFFRNLPEPLMSYGLHDAFIGAAKQESRLKRLETIHTLIHALPKPNFDMLHILTRHLNKVADKSGQNLMTVSNLSVCFGPTLLRPEDESVSSIRDIKFANVVVELLIEHCDKIFTTEPTERLGNSQSSSWSRRGVSTVSPQPSLHDSRPAVYVRSLIHASSPPPNASSSSYAQSRATSLSLPYSSRQTDNGAGGGGGGGGSSNMTRASSHDQLAHPQMAGSGRRETGPGGGLVYGAGPSSTSCQQQYQPVRVGLGYHRQHHHHPQQSYQQQQHPAHHLSSASLILHHNYLDDVVPGPGSFVVSPDPWFPPPASSSSSVSGRGCYVNPSFVDFPPPASSSSSFVVPPPSLHSLAQYSKINGINSNHVSNHHHHQNGFSHSQSMQQLITNGHHRSNGRPLTVYQPSGWPVVVNHHHHFPPPPVLPKIPPTRMYHPAPDIPVGVSPSQGLSYGPGHVVPALHQQHQQSVVVHQPHYHQIAQQPGTSSSSSSSFGGAGARIPSPASGYSSPSSGPGSNIVVGGNTNIMTNQRTAIHPSTESRPSSLNPDVTGPSSSSASSSSPSVPATPLPALVAASTTGGRRVRALYHCVAENPSELSFEPDAIIYDVRPSKEPGWLEGTYMGRTGLIPANYVQAID